MLQLSFKAFFFKMEKILNVTILINCKKHEFDLSNFEPGMYFLRYQDDKSDQMIKLIKQ